MGASPTRQPLQFRSADVKKLAPPPYWRAKLDYTNRLLLQFARCGDETDCFALEVIENQAYERSRFLSGATLGETKIEREPALADAAAGHGVADTVPLRWLHASRAEFELFDKPIVFDDAQKAVRGPRSPSALRGRLRVDLPNNMARYIVIPRLPEFLDASAAEDRAEHDGSARRSRS